MSEKVQELSQEMEAKSVLNKYMLGGMAAGLAWRKLG